MDKILIIDYMNAVWRANNGFANKHFICTKYCKHNINSPHCFCGEILKNNICQLSIDIIVYNFFRNLRLIVEQFVPNKVFLSLEGHPQFRYDLFAEYKGNRIVKIASKQSLNDKIYAAEKIIFNLLNYLPMTMVRASQYECDDVIATLCDDLNNENIVVISNDSDYIQLLQKHNNVKIYNPIKKEFMKAPEYVYVAWKALAGDKVDNISSLVSAKKAIEIVKNPDLFKKFMSVEENRANFSINRQLIEFRNIEFSDLIIKECYKDFDLLKIEFIKMKFESIVNDKSWKKFISTFNCIGF